MKLFEIICRRGNGFKSLPVVLALSFAVASMSLSGCKTTPAPPANSVAVAEVADLSRSFDYVRDAEEAAIKIAATLQPGDTMWVGAISENSLKKLDPLSLSTQKARTPNEIAAFLESRNQFKSRIGEWFGALKVKPQPGSDVCSAIRAAVYELNRSPAKKKALLVFSDMNDTVSRQCDVALAGIDVRLLYVYPLKNRPAVYSNYAERVRAQVAAASPASLEILFPVQAKTFEAERFISDLRRN